MKEIGIKKTQLEQNDKQHKTKIDNILPNINWKIRVKDK